MTAIARGSQAANPKVRHQSKISKYLPLYGMMLPFLLLFFVFTVWPLFRSIQLSLTDYTGIAAREINFVGVDNYRTLLSDERFHTSLWNIARYVFFTVTINTIVGIILAVVLQAQGKINQITRTLFFMPAVTSGLATTVVWKYVFRSDKYGLMNILIASLGGDVIRFLGTPKYYMPIFVFISIWGGCGMTMVFILAGLRSINPELNEAAAIDGADSWRRFWTITLPLLRPTLLYVVVTGTINAFQLFDMAYIISGGGQDSMGGPLDAGLTPLLYLYYLGFTRFNIGLASALAWILFLVIIVLSLILLRIGRFTEDTL
ncbi:MAG: sugar ABC transporter permease [Anaerolineae bacterium]|nr:sugar ABC transporter permease [Anaerolineae bacterium]